MATLSEIRSFRAAGQIGSKPHHHANHGSLKSILCPSVGLARYVRCLCLKPASFLAGDVLVNNGARQRTDGIRSSTYAVSHPVQEMIMSQVDRRHIRWLQLVGDLLQEPLTELPVDLLNQELTETFHVNGSCWTHRAPDGGGSTRPWPPNTFPPEDLTQIRLSLGSQGACPGSPDTYCEARTVLERSLFHAVCE